MQKSKFAEGRTALAMNLAGTGTPVKEVVCETVLAEQDFTGIYFE